MLRILVCIFLLASSAARAQLPFSPVPAPAAPAAAPAPAPAPATPAQSLPHVTPAEAQSLLEVLNDPQKRAQFTATLETLLKATGAPAAAKPAAPPAAAPAVPLAPNSIGAQVIARSASWANDLQTQVTSFSKVLGNLPAVWAFLLRTVNDPASRDDLFDAGWHLAVVVAVALLVQIGFKRALRRPVAALARLAPYNGEAEPAPPSAAGEHAVRRYRGFIQTLRALRRVPFMLGRLLLDLLPIATFLLLCWAGLNFLQPASQDVLWVVITAFAGTGVVVAVARALVAPDQPSLRVIQLGGIGPAYTVRWVRRLAILVAFGYAASIIGGLYGMPDPAREAFLKALALIGHIAVVIIVLQIRAPVARAIRGTGPLNSWGRRAIARVASSWHLIAIFFIAGLWIVWAAQVRHGYERMWRTFVVTAAIAIAMRLLAVVLLAGVDRLFRFSADSPAKHPGLEARAGLYYPLLRRAVSVAVWILALLTLFQAWGLDSFSWFRGRALGGQLATAAGTVLAALAVCLVVWEAVNASLDRNLAHHTRAAQTAKAARLRTLMPILRTLLFVVLATIFGLTALSEIGVNVAPLLAGAGIIGVAIGFGSQKLVQDFITGIFLLLENAMQVGDWVTVAGLSGSVENLSIRTMRLRAGDGSVHIIPFSSVSTVTNVNRGIGNAAISVVVPVEEDSDHVGELLADIARDMRADERFTNMMASDLQLWGVDKVDAGAVTIVGQIVCTDGGRWAVQREFNRRMNIRLKENGIRIATPIQTVYYHDVPAPKPKLPQLEEAPPQPEQVRESPPPAALGNSS